MARQIQPTAEQLRAALATGPRVNIEAAPGAGKTTVAAERFGMYRYRAGVDPRGVLALSFTKSARQELANRIRSRWGDRALTAPHAALTLDRLHLLLLTALLEAGHIRWEHSGDRTDPLDSWRGAAGARPLNAGQARWVATLNGTSVYRKASPAPYRGVWMSTASGLMAQLSAGVHTHDDVRSLVHEALARQDLRAHVAAIVLARFQAVIVDEVYDANDQDLDLISLLCEVGLPVTLIGDRWQALYGFRGARPNLVPAVLTGHGFVQHDVSHSFRYEGDALQLQMSRLRDGHGLNLEQGRALDCEVVLSTGWDQLWRADTCVLPIGLGQPENQSLALLTLLLDRVTKKRLGVEAQSYPEACFMLGLPPEDDARDAALDNYLDQLKKEPAPRIDSLRQRYREFGLTRRPRALTGARDATLDQILQRLQSRLKEPHVVRGLSVHQAKGREYDRVGLKLKPADVSRLTRGLNPDTADDRVLYVAVTRARRSTVLI